MAYSAVVQPRSSYARVLTRPHLSPLPGNVEGGSISGITTTSHFSYLPHPGTQARAPSLTRDAADCSLARRGDLLSVARVGGAQVVDRMGSHGIAWDRMGSHGIAFRVRVEAIHLPKRRAEALVLDRRTLALREP